MGKKGYGRLVEGLPVRPWCLPCYFKLKSRYGYILIELSINFEISNLDNSQKLQKFLYDIEYNNEKFLFLDNLKIKTLGLNIVKGATISSTLKAIASIEKKS